MLPRLPVAPTFSTLIFSGSHTQARDNSQWLLCGALLYLSLSDIITKAVRTLPPFKVGGNQAQAPRAKPPSTCDQPHFKAPYWASGQGAECTDLLYLFICFFLNASPLFLEYPRVYKKFQGLQKYALGNVSLEMCAFGFVSSSR